MSKPHTALDELADDGSFKRKDAGWRDWISSTDPGAKFPAESGRYHLFVAAACPWAHRTMIVRAMKGLEDVISLTTVMPVWKKTRPDDPNDTHAGWVFADPTGEPYKNSAGKGGPFPTSYPPNEPEPFFHSRSVRDLYERAGDIDAKYTVPILWDKKLNTIVSNESSEIIQMLNSEFDAFAKNPTLDLNPMELRTTMGAVDDWVYPNINNGVYRCGFARSQQAYDTAIEDLTSAFDQAEDLLSRQRYLAGDRFTLSDVRLFVTLLRFDEIYVVYFKTNTRSVANSPVLLNYVREIYQMPGVRETIYMDQIKLHYYASHPDLNQWSIVPRGSNFEAMLQQPHNRAHQLIGLNKHTEEDVNVREEKKARHG